MKNPTTLLTLTGVSHFFGSRLIFKAVSCQVNAGQVMLVTGANGAGKSTLLKIMAGLLEPATGNVLCSIPKGAMAFMGHQTFVYGAMTALANLEFWNQVYACGQTLPQLVALLDRVQLKSFALEIAGTFSRGMAQRLSLARVLLIKPDLVFLDEPATGLDTASQKILHTELDQARARGAGIVWVTHDLQRDLAQADTILHLAQRTMNYCGPTSQFPVESQP